MGSFFGAPSMLWWSMAAAVPIAIHLFQRRRYKRISWAAMAFLERAFKKTRKRLRLENLLLLLLRIAALLLLALVFANPRLGGDLFGGKEDTQQVILVVDTSYSMSAEGETGRTRFESAMEAAMEILDGLGGDGDAAALVTSGTPAHLIRTFTHEISQVRTAVEGLKPTHRSTDSIGGLRAAAALIVDPRTQSEFDGPKTVYWLTDLQQSALLASSSEDDGGNDALKSPAPELAAALRDIHEGGGQVVAFDVATEAAQPLPNVAITSLTQVGKTLVQGQATTFECRVTNFGADSVGGELQFFVDQEATFAQRIQVGNLRGSDQGTVQQREASFTFNTVFETPGDHYVAVKYVNDTLQVDNVRRHVVTVSRNIPVLLVDGSGQRDPSMSSTFFVARALDPTLGRAAAAQGAFRVKEISPTTLGAEDLSQYELIVLADVATLPSRTVTAIEKRVAEGAALFFFMGDTFNEPGRLGENGLSTRLYHRGGAGLLPFPLLNVLGGDSLSKDVYYIQIKSFDHPAMAYFKDEKRRPALTRWPIHRVIRLDVSNPRPDTRVLAWFRFAPANKRDGDTLLPGIIESTHGKGRVVTFATSADKTWNLLGTTPAFVPLMRELAHASVARQPDRNRTVGEAHTERFSAGVRKVSIAMGDQGITERDTNPDPIGESVTISLPPISEALLVTMSPAGGTASDRRLLAVNVDSTESQLDKANATFFSAIPGDVKIDIIQDLDDATTDDLMLAESRFWRPLLWALLAFLAIETLLGTRVSRNSQETGQ